MDRRLDIANAGVLVELSEQAKGFLHLFGDVGIQFDPRFDAPEQVGRHG